MYQAGEERQRWSRVGDRIDRYPDLGGAEMRSVRLSGEPIQTGQHGWQKIYPAGIDYGG